jgi:AsmA-like C-terminal region
LRLDRVVVSNGIALTDFRGETANRGGLTGDFVAGVNGTGRIQGAIVPQNGGSVVRIRSENAGQTLRAAGVFSSGRGGALELLLRSSDTPGSYRGTADISSIRVVDAPVLASLLNAVSVIGILEQLNGEGLLFSRVDVNFRMEAGSVQISRGAAIGASMGVSFAGLYNSETAMLDLQGTVSPFYILNGIGQIFSRRGEGLFGFNYRLSGPADNPQVSVNPLSILTPGMFRDIFRTAPPTLRNPGG